MGSVVLAGTTVLVWRRRDAHEIRAAVQTSDRSQHATTSRANSARSSPVPPRGSPLKVLPASPARSVAPGVARSATSSPALSMGAGASSPPGSMWVPATERVSLTEDPSGATFVPLGLLGPQSAFPSPQPRPAQARLGLRTPSSPRGVPFPKPLSPLGVPVAIPACSTSGGSHRTALKRSGSIEDYEDALESPELLPRSSASGSPSCCGLVVASSVSFSEAASLAGQQLAVGAAEPSCPRTTSFDGLLSAGHSSSRPASPSGLKLHVASVLRATAAAAAQSTATQAGPATAQELQPAEPVGQGGDTPVDSPRGTALLGLEVAVMEEDAVDGGT